MAAKKKTTKKAPKLTKKPERRRTVKEMPADDLAYYRTRLKECQEKLSQVRNELSALEALEATYLTRLAEMQGHR